MNIFLFLCSALLIITAINGMEHPEHDTSSAQNNEEPFPIDSLPINLQDDIAKFLKSKTKESDEEFLNRVDYKSQSIFFDVNHPGDHEYYNASFQLIGNRIFKEQYSSHDTQWKLHVYNIKTDRNYTLHEWTEYYLYSIQRANTDMTLIASAPDCLKCLIYDQHKGIIFDLITQQKIQEYNHRYRHLSLKEQYEAIALSRDGNYVAKVLRLCPKDEKETLQLHLFKINNNVCEKIAIAKLDLPYVSVLSFNKPGTQIMAYKHAHFKSDSDKHQIINLVSLLEHRQRTTKTLADFFREQGIRKNIPEQQ